MMEIAAFTLRVAPTDTLAGVVDDPDDHRVLECAVAARSHYIVTGDSDLLWIKRYQDIQIVRVAAFMEFLDA